MLSTGRAGPAIALALVAATLAVVLLGGGGDYRVHAVFETASQLVGGNEVQVAGKRVGLVEDIVLTEDGLARATLRIDDEAYRPLRQGTQAIVRQTSLAGVANRYVDLRMPPDRAPDLRDGATIPASDTVAAVDLDQLFDVFDPRTRASLQGVVEGQARAWAGGAREADAGLLYLNPALAATDRLLATLNRDPAPLERFLVASARISSDVAAERESLSALVTGADRALSAVAARSGDLDRGLRRLPPTLRRANTTLANVRAALDDLDPLLDDAGPAARALGPFAREARALAHSARPALRDLTRWLRTPGSDNDLRDLLGRLPALRDAGVRPVQANGARREAATTSLRTAAAGLAPIAAFWRPYGVDLTSWFDSFSHSGVYDATGGTGRIAFHFGAYQEVDGTLALVPADLRAQLFDQLYMTGQNNRCPGAHERGAVWKPTPDFSCDPGQVPLGP